MTPPTRLVHAGREGLGEVISAGGEIHRLSEARHITDASPIDRAVQVLTNPASLARKMNKTIPSWVRFVGVCVVAMA